MFNKLFSLIKPLEGMSHFSSLIGNLEGLIDNLHKNYLVDGDSKDAAIDAVIEILQAHKDVAKPPEVK